MQFLKKISYLKSISFSKNWQIKILILKNIIQMSVEGIYGDINFAHTSKK